MKDLKRLDPLYEVYNAGDNNYIGIGSVGYAQTFTVGAVGHTVSSIKLLLYRVGSPGTITVSIRATDVNGHPTGADLTSGVTDGNTLPTATLEWREILLTEYTLSANTKYAIVVRAPSGNPTNYPKWRCVSPSPTYDGGNCEQSLNSGGSWTSTTTIDCMFEVWGNLFAGAHNVTLVSSPIGVPFIQPVGITPFAVQVGDGGLITVECPSEIEV